MVREALVDHLRQQLTSVTVREASSLQQALDIASQSIPEVVVLDLSLDDAKGLDALVEMRRACPNARIVVLSGVVDDGMTRHLQELGADTFVSKAGRRDELVQTIRSLSFGSEAGGLSGMAVAPKHRLTPQQLAVLKLALAGSSSKEIGQHTGLAPGTVRNYLSEIFVIFGVNSRAQLMALFQR